MHAGGGGYDDVDVDDDDDVDDDGDDHVDDNGDDGGMAMLGCK